MRGWDSISSKRGSSHNYTRNKHNKRNKIDFFIAFFHNIHTIKNYTVIVIQRK